MTSGSGCEAGDGGAIVADRAGESAITPDGGSEPLSAVRTAPES